MEDELKDNVANIYAFLSLLTEHHDDFGSLQL